MCQYNKIKQNIKVSLIANTCKMLGIREYLSKFNVINFIAFRLNPIKKYVFCEIEKENTAFGVFVFNLWIIIIPKLLNMIAYFTVGYFLFIKPKQLNNASKARYLKNENAQILLWMNENNIIWGVNLVCVNESIKQGRSYSFDDVFNEMDVNISNCYFSRFSDYLGDGGVIYVVDSSPLNVKSSMFFNCSCSGSGGAIYFLSPYSNIGMVCANRCSCKSGAGGHFAYLQSWKVNQIDYLSLSQCNYLSSGCCSIQLEYRNLSVDNTNSSMNKAERGAGIRVLSDSMFASSFCTFSNNNVSDSPCIDIASDSKSSMSFSIIVHNNSPLLDGVVTIYGTGSIQIMYCIFQNNSDCLFHVSSGSSLELYHSFIDHSSSLYGSGKPAAISTNNSLSYRITYQIQYFNSHHCNADFPLPMRSFERTIEETKARTYDSKCEMSNDQSLSKINKKTNMFPIFISFILI